MSGTVDAHVHLLPGRLAEKVRGFFEAGGLVDLVYPLDHGEVCERLAADGISTGGRCRTHTAAASPRG